MEPEVGAMVDNKQVVLKGYIEMREPRESDLEVVINVKTELRAPKGSACFLVKNLYLSCDPYMRARMRQDSYIPPFVPGQAIQGFGVAEVVDSDNPDFRPGDYVSGFIGWEEYSLIQSTEQLRKVELDDQIPLSYHLGLLGMPGFTAYLGFYEVCNPKKGDYVLVSAAAGAVGQLVGQLAKLHGCYVVGSAGTNEKVDLLKNKLGFDEAFNYKEEGDLDAALKRYFPEGIDIYFDNVGGETLDAALVNMRRHGRIAICGMVSIHSYHDPKGIHNLFQVLAKSITMRGFVQSEFLHLYPQFLEFMTGKFKQGKIVYVEDMDYGLECAPAALAGLFTGKNVGKQVIRVAT